MKAAVLGGSFNPLHIGHLALADAVCTELHYDSVFFVPTNSPPHKEMQWALPPEQRLRMVQLACEPEPRFHAESCEIERGGVSYTYDTVLHLEQKYAGQLDAPLGLVLGADLLPGFHLWHRAQELAARCTLILARRPVMQERHSANRALGAYAAAAENQDFDPASEPLFRDAVMLENPVLPVSSTDIRARISSGRSFRYLVPEPVFSYIIEGRIYGYSQH